jgi:hypothetical protein
VLACALRLYLVVATTYIWDEDREWIPLSQSIGWSNLPWRSLSHSALTAYLVKGTSLLIGANPLGFRLAFALAGTAAVWAVGKLAWEWLGFEGAIVAAVAMGLNEYHLGISALATEKSPAMMCSAIAILNFGRFLKSERLRDLHLAALFTGLAFLFKETAVLLAPAFLAALVTSGRARWLARKELWLAAGLALIVTLPDLIWNTLHWEKGYGLHSGRVAGIGLTPHYVLFFGRDFLRDVYRSLNKYLFDSAVGYPAMNVVWGGMMLAAASTAVLRWRKLEPIGRLAAVVFWMILLFFSLSTPGQSRFIEETKLMVDTKMWFWVDQVLIGGVLLIAWCVVTAGPRWRIGAFGLVVAACVFSTGRVFGNNLGMHAVQMISSPTAIWPPDGRYVDVRMFVQTCQICDAQVRLLATRVNRFDGQGLVQTTDEEIRGAMPESDDRDFQVRVATGPNSDQRAYRFEYAVVVGKSHSVTLFPRVFVRPQEPAAPFWVR